MIFGVNSHTIISPMGEQKVSLVKSQKQMRTFVKSLLKDVQALEKMLEHDVFEKGITRIGAEQEMVLVHNHNYKAAPIAMDVLESLKQYPYLETELAKFNLEINLDPKVFEGDCFSQMEREIEDKLRIISHELDKRDASLMLTGILPTLRKHDLDMHNLTPKRRYAALMEAINRQLIGKDYELRMFGIDELLIKHKSPLLEACNTSFQIHLQTEARDFVKKYNIAQTLAAPILAIAANSPLVFGKRLWHESRIALFQQSIDVRTTHEHFRERSPRVSFGNDWLDDSVIEIFKEDISRFRILISSDIEENSLDMLSQNITPKLRALQVHNSTIYRWNRPCYGISENGMPHLRIENRVLPAGPTVKDEIANAALWLGCMVGLSDHVDDIRDEIGFIDTRDNFGKAAKFGVDSKFTWFKDRKVSAIDLVKELSGLAREGLKSMQVDSADIDQYLAIIDERVEMHMNGARWLLRSYTKLREETNSDEALSVITHNIINNQKNNDLPGHMWPLPELSQFTHYDTNDLTVSEIMISDVFTVQKDDVIELVGELMKWKEFKFLPVENTKGKLIGLISSKNILNYFNDRKAGQKELSVNDIMIKDPITVSGDTKVTDAIKMMHQENISCLPVVIGMELIGIITQWDILQLTSRLTDRMNTHADIEPKS